jgi:hypothetical protein
MLHSIIELFSRLIKANNISKFMFTFTGISDTCDIFIHNNVKNNTINVVSSLFEFETEQAIHQNVALIRLTV